jgi:hypothetical protein
VLLDSGEVNRAAGRRDDVLQTRTSGYNRRGGIAVVCCPSKGALGHYHSEAMRRSFLALAAAGRCVHRHTDTDCHRDSIDPQDTLILSEADVSFLARLSDHANQETTVLGPGTSRRTSRHTTSVKSRVAWSDCQLHLIQTVSRPGKYAKRWDLACTEDQEGEGVRTLEARLQSQLFLLGRECCLHLH